MKNKQAKWTHRQKIARVAQAIWAFDHERDIDDPGYNIMDCWRREQYRDCAKAALKSIGLTAPKKGKKL